jgi:hypothetical protein
MAAVVIVLSSRASGRAATLPRRPGDGHFSGRDPGGTRRQLPGAFLEGSVLQEALQTSLRLVFQAAAWREARGVFLQDPVLLAVRLEGPDSGVACVCSRQLVTHVPFQPCLRFVQAFERRADRVAIGRERPPCSARIITSLLGVVLRRSALSEARDVMPVAQPPRRVMGRPVFGQK